jgi:phosphoribosylanthranilate isomerase
MTRVKICGITNLEDAQVAVQFGADLLGFVFYPPSPRYVTPEGVREIVPQIRPISNLQSSTSIPHFVGVFVDQGPEVVAHILDFCGLNYAQLHGAEPPETVTTLMERKLGVIKAFRVRDEASLAQIERYRATAYLLDTYVPGQPGGTGHHFDWTLAVRAVKYGPVILAGGLTPDNVAEAVRTIHPWGVDVSSGVEAEPGRKDHDRLRRFIAAAKSNNRAIQ